jgi:hypothetical protein
MRNHPVHNESASKVNRGAAFHHVQGQGGVSLMPPSPIQAVVQRQLRQSKNARNEMETIEASDIGAAGVVLEYAKRLSDDTAALVDGKVNTKKPGVIAELKAAVVDGGALSTKLVKIILDFKEWAEMTGPEIVAFAAGHRAEEGEDAVEDEDAADALDYLKENVYRSRPSSEKWVKAKLGVSAATTSGAALTAAGAAPDAWKGSFIDQLYEATKANWYAIGFTPYIPPFKELINDVNAGDAIEAFDYVRKYPVAAGGFGAEFNVEEPDDRKTHYANKAVLHTHYATNTSVPNYAHTKPYDQRFSSGYGYTAVTLANVTGIDDTQKAYNAL